MINDYYNAPFNFFVPLKDHQINGGITWIALGDLFSKPTFFNNVAVGGTSTQQWVEKYINRVLDALAIADYDAILWVQGESDTGLKIPSQTTYNNMVTIISRSNQVRPRPWYVAIDGPGSDTRAAQERLVHDGYAYRGVDLDQLRKEHPEYWDKGIGEIERLEGHKAHAKMWYDILKGVYQ